MDKRQTAVEWLIDYLKDLGLNYQLHALNDIIEQGKAMEKEQIIAANEDCSTNELGELLSGEQYYTSIYGK